MSAQESSKRLGLELSLVCGNSLHPEPIRWLWDGWLAKGKLHVLAGAPGTGKTTLAVSLAAVITVGGTWPDSTQSPVGDVLMWSAEDDVRDTLIPRFHAAGADMSRVWFIDQVSVEDGFRVFDPAFDLALLEEKLSQMSNPVLLIVDPIVNVIAGDSHKNGEVRRSLAPLVTLAERYRIAVFGITHFSKGTAGRDPTERVTGSVAFGALARVVLIASKGISEVDGEEADRLFMRSKSNIGQEDGGFRYTLDQVPRADYEGVDASVVRWRGIVDGEARDALAIAEASFDGEGNSALREAQEFLVDLLANGPVNVTDVQTAANRAGHTFATLKRAKQKLSVKTFKRSMSAGWAWKLAEGDQVNTKKLTQNSVGSFDIY